MTVIQMVALILIYVGIEGRKEEMSLGSNGKISSSPLVHPYPIMPSEGDMV